MTIKITAKTDDATVTFDRAHKDLYWCRTEDGKRFIVFYGTTIRDIINIEKCVYVSIRVVG